MKKETLEEAAIENNKHNWKDTISAFTSGAKWQAKRMYSEKEVQELLIKALTHKDNGYVGNLITIQNEIRTANFGIWFEKK